MDVIGRNFIDFFLDTCPKRSMGCPKVFYLGCPNLLKVSKRFYVFLGSFGIFKQHKSEVWTIGHFGQFGHRFLLRSYKKSRSIIIERPYKAFI
jgi:hypothetical protein